MAAPSSFLTHSRISRFIFLPVHRLSYNNDNKHRRFVRCARYLHTRCVGRTKEELTTQLYYQPDQPENSRILRVAIVGPPNVGKSTLTNKLLDWRVSSVSSRVHTTIKTTTGIKNVEDTQLIFLDTPGLVLPSQKKKYNLANSLVLDPYASLRQADLVAVMVDVSNSIARKRLEEKVLQILHISKHKPAILILNKVDAIPRKNVLLQVARNLTGGFIDGKGTTNATQKTKKSYLDLAKYMNDEKSNCDTEEEGFETDVMRYSSDLGSISLDNDQHADNDNETIDCLQRKLRNVKHLCGRETSWKQFEAVFMVSAINGDGVAELREYLIFKAKPGDWKYHSSLVTDQTPLEIAKMCVWEKLLEYLPKEIPYNITVKIPYWEVNEDGILNCIIELDCKEKNRYLKYALGKRGATVGKIAREAKQEMMNTFKCDISLKLVVK